MRLTQLVVAGLLACLLVSQGKVKCSFFGIAQHAGLNI